MIRIGALELEAAPRIAVPLDDRRLGERVAAARQWADVVELRVDMFGSPDADTVAAACKIARAAAPVLVTVRSHAEGGAAALSDERRLALYAAAAAHADAVDVELRSPICDAVLRLAGERGLTAIVSHHDFAATPDDAALRALADEARERGATITKIATTANDAGDRNRLLDLLRRRVAADQGMIVIAMGAHGAASRVFFPLCGSLLTYGFLDEAVAPGQLSIRALRAELERYCPELNEDRGVRSEE
jgi:3-dehydroquinate dehydratase I